MNARPSTYLQGLGSLQLLAVLAVVIGHYWAHDTVYLNSVGVSFCFVYSGYFTRKRHAFGPGYGLKDHGRFLWNKLARLYPLHLLGIALGILGSFLTWHAGGVGPKIMLAHLTLTSPWLANPAYYFGANPVAWFICVLFFLYAVAPIVVRLLARIPTRWQVALIAVLIALEFIIGYAPDIETHSRLLGRYTHYALYQFPPIRLLDFATGIVLYNVSQTGWWQSVRQRLTPRHSTVIEVTALVGFIALYYVGKQWLHPHCYRSLAASVPVIIVLLPGFVLTSEAGGTLTRLLSVKPLAALSPLGAEIYLLQFGVNYCLLSLYQQTVLPHYPIAYLLVRLCVLVGVCWLVHRCMTTPLYRRIALTPTDHR